MERCFLEGRGEVAALKILITSDWYKPTVNGVVASVLNLKRSLEELGHEVRVLTLRQEGVSGGEPGVYYVRSISANKIYPHARVMCSAANRQIAAIVRWRPDIVHSQCEFSTFLFAHRIAKKLKIPIVHTYHTVYEDYTHYFSPSKRVGKKVAKNLSRTFLNYTQAVVAPTNKVRDILNSYEVMRPIVVIPTGIDLKTVSHAVTPERRDELRRKYGIPEEDHVMLFLGRLAKEKNVDELIKFFGEMRRDDVTFLIVGDGPARGHIERCAAESPKSGKIVFTGMVRPDEVSEYYSLGDIFVSASTSETQGLTYIEALANGLPALCRRDPCLDGIIIDRENGLQYETSDEFISFLDFYFSDECCRDEMKTAARSAGYEFSSEKFGARMEKYYMDTLTIFYGRQKGYLH